LTQFDSILRNGLSTILNVNLSDTQWLQASLPVSNGGLGIRSARMLAPSAFLASAAFTRSLQQSILPDEIMTMYDGFILNAEARWLTLSNTDMPATEPDHIQKAWDRLVTKN